MNEELCIKFGKCNNSGWYNLCTIWHNACNCLHVWKIKHIMYIQKKSLVSKWCFVAATPIYIHHHTSNHNLTIFLFVFMFCIQHSAAAVTADTFRHRWHVVADLKAFIYLLYLNTYTTKAVQWLDKTVPYNMLITAKVTSVQQTAEMHCCRLEGKGNLRWFIGTVSIT